MGLCSYYLLEYAYGYDLTYFTFIFAALCLGIFILSSKGLRLTDYWLFFSFTLIVFLIFGWQAAFHHTLTPVLIGHQLSNGVLTLLGFFVGRQVWIKKMDIKAVLGPYRIKVAIFLLFVLILFKVQNLVMDSLFMRLGGMDYNPVGLAYSICLTLMFIIGVMTPAKKWERLILVIFLITLLGLLFLTGSRGAMVMILGVYGAVFVLTGRLKWYYPILVLGLIVIIVLIGIEMELMVFDRFKNLFNFVSDKKDIAINDRLFFYQDMREHFFDYSLYGQYGYKLYPHNILFEFLVRFGLFFGSILFMFVAYPLAFVFINLKTLTSPKNPLSTLIFIFIFCFFYAFISLSLDNNKLLWLTCGVVYGIITSNQFKFKLNKIDEKADP